MAIALTAALLAGLRPIDIFAVELNCIDLGQERGSIGAVGHSVDSKAYAAFAVGYLPLPLVDLYAKAGVARWKADARLGSLAARLKHERFDVSDTDGAVLISLGITWTFF